MKIRVIAPVSPPLDFEGRGTSEAGGADPWNDA